jgi:hypothetical protein
MNNNFTLYLVIYLAFMPLQLFAYIDPGSGGALLSAILGFFAAIIYSIRKYFYKIKSFFKK